MNTPSVPTRSSTTESQQDTLAAARPGREPSSVASARDTKPAAAGFSDTSPETAPAFDRQEAIERLVEQAERVVAEVRALGSTASESASDALTSAKTASKVRAREAQDDVRDYVESYPVKSLLIAAGVGALFGMWSRR